MHFSSFRGIASCNKTLKSSPVQDKLNSFLILSLPVLSLLQLIFAFQLLAPHPFLFPS